MAIFKKLKIGSRIQEAWATLSDIISEIRGTGTATITDVKDDTEAIQESLAEAGGVLDSIGSSVDGVASGVTEVSEAVVENGEKIDAVSGMTSTIAGTLGTFQDANETVAHKLENMDVDLSPVTGSLGEKGADGKTVQQKLSEISGEIGTASDEHPETAHEKLDIISNLVGGYSTAAIEEAAGHILENTETLNQTLGTYAEHVDHIAYNNEQLAESHTQLAAAVTTFANDIEKVLEGYDTPDIKEITQAEVWAIVNRITGYLYLT